FPHHAANVPLTQAGGEALHRHRLGVVDGVGERRAAVGRVADDGRHGGFGVLREGRAIPEAICGNRGASKPPRLVFVTLAENARARVASPLQMEEGEQGVITFIIEVMPLTRTASGPASPVMPCAPLKVSAAPPAAASTPRHPTAS